MPVQLDDYQTRRYLRMGFVGCKIAIDGEMEQTSAYPGGFVVKARQVDYLSYRKSEDAAAEAAPTAPSQV